MRRRLRLILLALVLATVGVSGAYAADSTDTAETWDVSVGLMMNHDTEMFSMQPGTIYIHEGDTVVFTNKDVLAPHIVTFLAGNPRPEDEIPVTPSGSKWDGTTILNSEEMNPGGTFSVIFTKSGAFSFYCDIHPSMTGVVVVVPKGQPIPNKVEQAAHEKAYLNEIMKLTEERIAYYTTPQYTKDAKGALTYKVNASLSNSQVMVNAFLPGELYINAGDTVEWTNLGGEAHLAVINMPKGTPFFTENGLNEAVAKPSNPIYDGKGMATTGIIGPELYGLKTSGSITFTAPGTYTVDDNLWGFSGKIVVAPKGATKLVVNGKAVVVDTVVKNGHVFVPLRGLGNALGIKFAVDGKKQVTINGKKLVAGSDAAPYFKNGTAYVAADSVAQLLGHSYSWDQTAKTFTITTK
ncbi:stalk domain-containing protein [Cohnella sp. AR92]|uniref:stalk domain-containing protein n=1 Tax=Cohnella sp. AR92 TaxID=648716 RepID=UPI000F8C7C42|nr:stalk domain-containing protein [Cohnella sp. AR92]RUS43885.1 hypothetical protein ELR57_23740 [Cohnella sp. AR92]